VLAGQREQPPAGAGLAAACVLDVTAGAGSDAAASRSSSKRGTSNNVCGSTSANSSSMPTVKSAEPSKVSRAMARSIIGAGD
jgi:hypothetical protein